MRMNFNRSIVLLIISSLIIFPMILSVLSVTPSLEVTSAIYEVDDEGNLVIRLTGSLTSISVDSCLFCLDIPENFEIGTLADGSPQVELVNAGSPSAITSNGDQFETKFVVSTSGTTSLPYNYTLEVSHAKGQFLRIIIPTWPDQGSSIGGSGAEINWFEEYPYITSFYAYDSYKADSELVKTYIYNPDDFFDWYITGIKYKLKGYNYNNWEDWTPEKSAGIYIFPHQTKVVEHNLASTFTTVGSKSYALNTGVYQVTQVYARGCV